MAAWHGGFVPPRFFQQHQVYHRRNPHRNYTAKVLYNQCKIHWNNKEYQKCISILNKLLDDYPFNDHYHSFIARSFDKIHEYHKSYYHHRKAIEMSPSNPIYHLNYAQYLYKDPSSSNKDAKTHFIQALKLSVNIQTLHLVANIHSRFAKFVYETENDIKTAKYHYEMALKYNDHQLIHLNYAKLLNQSGDLKTAEFHYKQSIRTLNNSEFRWWHNFECGIFLRKIGKYEEAEEQFIICLKWKPTLIDVLYEYGVMLCENMKKYELGLNYLQRECQLSCGNQDRFIQAYYHYKNVFDGYSNNQKEGH